MSVLQEVSYSFKHYLLSAGGMFKHIAEGDYFLNVLNTTASAHIDYRVNNEPRSLASGDSLLLHLAEGDDFEIDKCSPDNQLFIILYPVACLEELQQQLSRHPQLLQQGIITKTDSRLQLLLDKLNILACHKTIRCMERELLLLEAMLLQIRSMDARTEPEHKTNSSHHEKMLMAKRIIDADLSQNYTIPELAKRVGTNVQYLKTYFKQYFGKTVMTYVTERKMEYAKELMLTGNHRVADVAQMTGYKHPTHFTTAFKKHFGFIPNSLRY